MKKFRHYAFVIFILLFVKNAGALTFAMPKNGNIVGSLQTAIVQKGETLGDIGRRFDIGVYEMIEANPKLNPWNPSVGSKVVVPTQFILPETQDGIVINLAEMRLYFFQPTFSQVSTHPIGIGRKGWRTPLGQAKIIEKKKDPAWRPPQSIRNSYKRKGKTLPTVVPPGPENPLGQYAMRLSLPGYLIHGTNRPGGIVVRSSSGCIRLFPEDIESLFYKTNLGTKVEILHAPYKVGRQNNQVFIEAHEPLTDAYYQKIPQDIMYNRAFKEAKIQSVPIDFSEAEELIDDSNGYPIVIAE